MAVLINNRKCPNSCEDCDLVYISYHNDDDFFCIFREVEGSINEYTENRHPNCPLETPKSGNTCMDEIRKSLEEERDKINDLVNKIPTIVEAT